MDSHSGSVSDSISHGEHGTWQIALIIFLGLAVIASVVVSMVIGYHSAFAAGPQEATECLPDCVASGVISYPVHSEDGNQPDFSPKVVSPMVPALAGHTNSFGSELPLRRSGSIGQPMEVYVWTACLTVAEYSDGESTYLGYIPDLAPNEGDLTSANFTYGDSSLTVENLYYQETGTGVRRLVLEVDAPLHDELILYAGNMEFPFSASTMSGLGPNYRAWMLDSSLGWAQGQSVLVVLREAFGMPMNGAGQGESGNAGSEAFCGNPSEPVISLPQRLPTVWKANLLVGEASDSQQAYMGYMPAMSPREGDLDDTTFTHDGVEYTVLTIFYQEVGRVRQLVFASDPQLPDELILEIGEDEFPVADSLKLGADGNIHAWRLDSSLGWAEGQSLQVRLEQPEE